MTDEEIYVELAKLPPLAEIQAELDITRDEQARARDLYDVAYRKYARYQELQHQLADLRARGPVAPGTRQITAQQVRGALKRYGLGYLAKSNTHYAYGAGYTVDQQTSNYLPYFERVVVRYRGSSRKPTSEALVATIENERLNYLLAPLERDFTELQHDLAQHPSNGYMQLWLGRYREKEKEGDSR